MYALTKQPADEDGPPSTSSTAADDGVGIAQILEDLGFSTDEDEDEDVTEDVFNSIVASYMFKRNIIVSTYDINTS